jgi:IS5 family transposase
MWGWWRNRKAREQQALRDALMAKVANCHEWASAASSTHATGTAERDAGLALVRRQCRERARRITLGADKAYDVAGLIADLRAEKVTPHIAIDGHVRVSGKPRKTAIDGRTTRHPGYAVSQRKRKRIEEIFGWINAVGGVAQVKVRGLAKVKAAFTFAVAAYNLLRIPKLLLSDAA